MKSFKAWQGEQKVEKDAEIALKEKTQQDLKRFGNEVVEYYKGTRILEAGQGSSNGLEIRDSGGRRIKITSNDGIAFDVVYFMDFAQQQSPTKTKKALSEGELCTEVAYFIEN